MSSMGPVQVSKVRGRYKLVNVIQGDQTCGCRWCRVDFLCFWKPARLFRFESFKRIILEVQADRIVESSHSKSVMGKESNVWRLCQG